MRLGAGHISLVARSLQVLLALYAQQSLGADAGAWIVPAAWPYIQEITALPDRDTLVLVEENGADLQITLPDGAVSDSPGRRRVGPEVLFLPAGSSATLQLEPVAKNLPPGRFRIQLRALNNSDELRAAQALATAGAAATGSQENLEEACHLYASIVDATVLPAEWRAFARYQTVSCNIRAGIDNDPTLLNSLTPVENSSISLLAYQTIWLQAYAVYVSDQYAPAQVLFLSALKAAERAAMENPDKVAAIRLDMVEIRVYIGALNAILSYFSPGSDSPQRLSDSESILRQALAEAEGAQEHAIAGFAYDFLAAVAYIGGDTPGVIENLLKAKAAIELANQPLELLTILGSIGDFYKNQGDQRNALQAYLEAVTIIERYDRTGDARAGDTYDNLGTLYFNLGDLPRAVDLMRRAIAIAEAGGNIWRAHLIRAELSEVFEQQGDLPAAMELIREAHAFLVAQPETWSPYRLYAQTTYSRLALKQGQTALAVELSQEIMRNLDADSLPTGNVLVPIQVNHSRILHAAGRSAEAVQLLEASLAETATQPVDKIAALEALHEIHAASGREQETLVAAEAAFQLVESQQMEIESVRLGPYWSGRTHGVYAAHLEYWLAPERAAPDVARAFAIAERARASNLRVRRQAVLRQQDTTNPEAEALWRDLLAEVQHSASPDSEADSLTLERNIATARERYFVAHGESIDAGQIQNLSLDSVAASLPDDTALVQYLGGATRFWRLDIQGGTWVLTDIGPITQVAAMIDAVRFELSSPNNRQQNLRALSELLLKEFIPAANTMKLLVSPDESMHAVPFSALHFGNGYMGDVGTLMLVPSVSQYLATTPTQPQPGALHLAVLADPDFGVVAPAPGYGEPPETFRSWSSEMQRLPASAVEAEALSAYFAEDERVIFTDAKATQENFFSDAVRNADIIHIATHGYFNDEMPELVGLVLARSSDTDDGFVSMAEISTVKFAADLIVVSACSTGQGELISGEGNISLARTFLAQGVNSVISTLWPISDRATAIFMKEFYRSLKVDGVTYDLALQSAQRVLQDDPQYRNPYYWAAFTLTSAVPLSGSAL